MKKVALHEQDLKVSTLFAAILFNLISFLVQHNL